MAKKTEKKKFVTIHELDDWGVKHFYLKAPTGTTHSHRDMDQTARVKDGDAFEVQFPDKSVVKAIAKVTTTKEWVSDTWHDYTVDSESLRLVFLTPLNFRGIDFPWWSNFTNIKVKRV